MSAAEARDYWRAAQRRRPRLHRELLRALRERRALRDELMGTREARALRELASAVLPEAWQEAIKRRMGERSCRGLGRRSGRCR